MASRSGIMLCYPFEEKRFIKWGSKALIQPKLDGERCRAVIEDGKCTLLSSELNEFRTVPHINEQLEASGLKNIELDGELYVHGMPFSEIHSIVSSSRVGLSMDYMLMEYHIFDIIEPETQLRRFEHMLFLPEGKNLELVLPTYVDSYDSIMDEYKEYMECGYEGFVLRHPTNAYIRRRATTMMKFKPKKDDYYKIVGYLEEYDKHGNPKGRLGRLICMGSDGTEFPVYSGVSDQARQELWEQKDQLIGKLCHVYYQNLFPKTNKPRNATVMEGLGPVIVDVAPDYIGIGGSDER